MHERDQAERLDAFLDDLVTGKDHDDGGDPNLARTARRYHALGHSSAPAGARDRVQRGITQNTQRPHQNGLAPTREGPELRHVFPGVQPGGTRELPPARDAVTPASLLPARGRRIQAPVALVLFLALGVGMLVVAQTLRRPEQLTTIPAVIDSIVSPVPTVTPFPPVSDDQALVVVDLPAGSLPPSFGATFDHRTMPPHSESTEVTEGPFLLRYLVSGHVTVRADGPMQLMRAGSAGTWEAVAGEDERTLDPDDVIFVRGAASVTWGNDGAEPADVIAWAMTAGGGGNSSAPQGWGVHNNAAIHMARLDQHDAAARVRLRRIELAPGADLASQPGAVLDQIVYLDVNAAGEQVAPMLGKLPNDGRRNVGRQALTIYEMIVESLGGDRGSPAVRSAAAERLPRAVLRP